MQINKNTNNEIYRYSNTDNLIEFKDNNNLDNKCISNLSNSNYLNSKSLENLYLDYSKEINYIESMLNYKFNNKALIIESLTYRSCSKSKKNYNKNIMSYERLELLGDSVLKTLLIENFILNKTDFTVGRINNSIQKITNNNSLCDFGYYMKLENYIINKNNQNTFNLDLEKDSCKNVISKKIVADIIESIIGSIYIDCQDMKLTSIIVINWFKNFFEIDLNSSIIKENNNIMHLTKNKSKDNYIKCHNNYYKSINNENIKNKENYLCMLDEQLAIEAIGEITKFSNIQFIISINNFFKYLTEEIFFVKKISDLKNKFDTSIYYNNTFKYYIVNPKKEVFVHINDIFLNFPYNKNLNYNSLSIIGYNLLPNILDNINLVLLEIHSLKKLFCNAYNIRICYLLISYIFNVNAYIIFNFKEALIYNEFCKINYIVIFEIIIYSYLLKNIDNVHRFKKYVRCNIEAILSEKTLDLNDILIMISILVISEINNYYNNIYSYIKDENIVSNANTSPMLFENIFSENVDDIKYIYKYAYNYIKDNQNFDNDIK